MTMSNADLDRRFAALKDAVTGDLPPPATDRAIAAAISRGARAPRTAARGNRWLAWPLALAATIAVLSFVVRSLPPEAVVTEPTDRRARAAASSWRSCPSPTSRPPATRWWCPRDFRAPRSPSSACPSIPHAPPMRSTRSCSCAATARSSRFASSTDCKGESLHEASSARRPRNLRRRIRCACQPQPPATPDVKAQLKEYKEYFKHLPIDDRFLADLDEQLSRMPATAAFLANEFGPPREIVKNAPYTAEAVTESIQVLSDGNRIVRKSTTLLARDTAGRTRQERKDGGNAGVYIFDPMDSRTVLLNERTRTAIPIPRPPTPPEPPVPPVPPSRPPARRRRHRRLRTATSKSSPAASSCAATAACRAARTTTSRWKSSASARDPRRRHAASRTAAAAHAADAAARQGRDEVARHARVRRHQGRRHHDLAHDPRGQIGNEKRS
jgi:hypothetical protein